MDKIQLKMKIWAKHDLKYQYMILFYAYLQTILPLAIILRLDYNHMLVFSIGFLMLWKIISSRSLPTAYMSSISHTKFNISNQILRKCIKVFKIFIESRAMIYHQPLVKHMVWMWFNLKHQSLESMWYIWCDRRCQ